MVCGRSKEIRLQFQTWFCFKSVTFRSYSALVNGPSINYFRGTPLIQLSCHTPIFSPLPILQPIPFANTGNPTIMAFQLGDEGNLSGFTECLLKSEQYFLSITFAQRDSFSWNILQFSFASKAMFFAFNVWMPMPPSSFDLIILFQPTRWSFLFSHVDPQRKFRFTLSSFSHKWVGRAYPCITLLGMDDITALTKTTRPAKDKNFVFHPASRSITFSNTKLNWFLPAPLYKFNLTVSVR